MKPKAIRGKTRKDDVVEVTDFVSGAGEDVDVFSGGGRYVSAVENAIEVMKERSAERVQYDVVLPAHLSGKDLLNHFQDLKTKLDSCIFDIAETMYYIHLTEAYKDKYTSFDSYAYEEFGRESRSAYYYVQLYSWISKSVKGVGDIDRVKKLGYTKSLELAKAKIKGEELDQYLEIAENSKSVKELQGAIKQIKQIDKESEDRSDEDDKSPKNPDRPTLKTFSWPSEQYEIVCSAISNAKKVGNTTVDSHAMYLVCESFLNDMMLQENPEKHLKEILNKIEKLANIRLIAIDPKDNKVLWGKELLDD